MNDAALQANEDAWRREVIGLLKEIRDLLKMPLGYPQTAGPYSPPSPYSPPQTTWQAGSQARS